jgi:hypothetical protein
MRTGISGREEVHRDAAAHCAGADHADLVDGARRGVFRQSLDLGGLALGEEEILLRLGLGAGHQLHEQLALGEHAFRIRLGNGCLDRADVVFGRLEAAELAGVGLAEFVEHAGVRARFLKLVVPLAGLLDGADVLHFVRIGDGVLFEVALDQAVHETDGMGFLGADGRAGGGHFQRLCNARHAGQALGAAGTGEEAEFHFGNAQLRRRHGDSVVGGESDFEAAAEGGAVNRGDHRLGAIFDNVDDLRKHRLGEGLGRAEFADIGSGEEGLALADDDHRLHALVRIGLLNGVDQTFAHGVAERVHRRIVRCDDEDVAVVLGRNRAHPALLVLLFATDWRTFT